MPFNGKVLIIDDEESLRIGCAQALEPHGYVATLAADGEAGIRKNTSESFDVALLDLRMPGLSGMEVLQRLKQDAPELVVIIMTAYGTIDSAVEAMKRGAYDYITKPFTPEMLLALVEKAVSSRKRSLEYRCIDQALGVNPPSEGMIGRSEAMAEVAKLLRKAAPTDSTVLITGETGVGKEVAARAIHRMSTRASRCFVTVDCGTLVESLFESELFGHVKGAFSGASESTAGKIELADGGTLFLDEISNITINMQARLLRAVQEKEICRVGSNQKKKVDVRIISATNRDLPQSVREGKFREDLFYRLNVINVQIPPLRDRIEDIPPLVAHYVKKLALDRRKAVTGVSDEVMRFLKRREWPGNVRELINALEFAVVTCEGNIIELQDLPYETERAESGGAIQPGSLSETEQYAIAKALERFSGNKTRAAEYLGINRKTLREKMRKFGMEAAGT